MYDPVWEAVARLELCGFRIMALVCDRLAANRKLFRLHNPVTKLTDINQQSKNPYADDGRCLYFICDPQAPGVALLTQLKYEHIFLTSYSKMRVDLAAQVRKIFALLMLCIIIFYYLCRYLVIECTKLY